MLLTAHQLYMLAKLVQIRQNKEVCKNKFYAGCLMTIDAMTS